MSNYCSWTMAPRNLGAPRSVGLWSGDWDVRGTESTGSRQARLAVWHRPQHAAQNASEHGV